MNIMTPLAREVGESLPSDAAMYQSIERELVAIQRCLVAATERTARVLCGQPPAGPPQPNDPHDQTAWLAGLEGCA